MFRCGGPLLKGEGTPPSSWTLARVECTCPEPDSIVTVVAPKSRQKATNGNSPVDAFLYLNW